MSEALSAGFPDAGVDLELDVIALQNDFFRKAWPRAPVPGRFIMEPSIKARPGRFQVACLEAIRRFDDFAIEFDPLGTHQVGVTKVDGVWIRFDISLNDPTSGHPCKEPADIDRTMRVLRIAVADLDR